MSRRPGPGASVSDYFSTFIDNPGTPLLHLELQCAPDKTPQLKVSQSRYLPSGTKASAAQIYKIPMCFRYPTPEGSQLRYSNRALALEGQILIRTKMFLFPERGADRVLDSYNLVGIYGALFSDDEASCLTSRPLILSKRVPDHAIFVA